MKIYVIKNNVPIGTLSEDAKGNITFDYLKNIQSNQYITGLEDKKNASSTLFPVFENLLPEHEQLNEIRLEYNIKREIDLLLYLDNIHGSFEFCREGDFSATSYIACETFKYSDVVGQILNSEYPFPNILHEYLLNIPNDKLHPVGLTGSKVMGISGFQYKFSVHKNDNLNKISFDNHNSSEYIMKPYNIHYSKFTPTITDSAYIPYLLINEHLFMTMARDFGFKVPYNGIIRHKDDYHYIIKRYDRYDGMKIDHHEILTLLGKQSNEKYTVSCKEIMNVVSKYLDEDEILQLYRFMVFSIVISHGDLHAKNISLIFKSNALNERGMTLAPIYDVSTVGIYKDTKGNDIGMKVKNKRNNIKLDDLLWLAEIAHIERDIASNVIKDISSKFLVEFESYIDRLPSEIRKLPVYTSKYRAFDTFEKVLRKFYGERKLYISKNLLTKVETVKDDLWE